MGNVKILLNKYINPRGRICTKKLKKLRKILLNIIAKLIKRLRQNPKKLSLSKLFKLELLVILY